MLLFAGVHLGFCNVNVFSFLYIHLLNNLLLYCASKSKFATTRLINLIYSTRPWHFWPGFNCLVRPFFPRSLSWPRPQVGPALDPLSLGTSGRSFTLGQSNFRCHHCLFLS
jgi:hypothetical protein